MTGLQFSNDLDEIPLVHGQLEARVSRRDAPDDLAEQERCGDEVAADMKLADDLPPDPLGAVVESPLRLQEPASLSDEGSPR